MSDEKVLWHQAARSVLMGQCIQRRGAHDWRLHLDPLRRTAIEIYCSYCPATLDDEWTGASSLIHIDLPEFTVKDGLHSAKVIVDWAIDVHIRESRAFSPRSGEQSSTFSIDIKLRGQEALPGREEDGHRDGETDLAP